MIKIGTDLVYMPRLEKHVSDPVWCQRILTQCEYEQFSALKNERRRLEYLCGRFAAKEAYSKACGVGIGVIDFKDFEVLADELGCPRHTTHQVSISHDHEYTIATVLVYEDI